MGRLGKLLSDPVQFYRDSTFGQKVRAVARSSHVVMPSANGADAQASVENALGASVGAVLYGSDRGRTVGVLEANRRLAFEQLQALNCSRTVVQVTANRARDGGDRGDREYGREMRRSKRWTVRLRRGGTNAEVVVEFWADTPDAFICPSDSLIAKRVYKKGPGAAAFARGTPLELSALHPRPTGDVCTSEVDLAFTWVDQTDENWQALRRAHAPAAEAEADASLFENRDELKFALRSFALNAPWIRNVYLVTNCRAPAWLDVQHPRVQVVSHESILPSDALPTFNSHSIETALHKIDGLSPKFIYANDDMLLLRPVRKELFVQGNGMTRSFLEPYGIVNGDVDESAPAYLNAARNGKRLLEHALGVSFTRLHVHAPYALNRDVLAEMEERFGDAFTQTRHRKFRTPEDISVTSFLYHHYAYHQRMAVAASMSCTYLSPGMKSHKDVMAALMREPTTTALCINDSSATVGSRRAWNRAVVRCLQGLFPEPCEFER